MATCLDLLEVIKSRKRHNCAKEINKNNVTGERKKDMSNKKEKDDLNLSLSEIRVI